MTSEGFWGDVNGDFVDKHASKFPLMSMVGKAIPSIIRIRGVRTPIGMSVNMSSLSIFLHGFQAKKLSLIQKELLKNIQLTNRKLGPVVSGRIYEYLFY